MLQNIHDKTSSWIARFMIAAIVFAFAFWGIQRLFVSGRSRETVIKVNGSKITKQQLSLAYQHLQRQVQQQLGKAFFNDATLPQRLKKTAAQQLIGSTLLTKQMHHDGYVVVPTLLTATIAAMPIFQDDHRFSVMKFQQIVAAMGYKPRQFLLQLKYQLLANQLRHGLVQSAFMLPKASKNAWNLLHQRRRFRYVMIDDRTFSNNIAVTNAAINRYYQDHKQQFLLKEKISIQYLQLFAPKVTQSHLGSLQKSHLNQKNEKQKQDFIKKSQQLSNLIDEYPNNLQAIAKTLGLKINTTHWFSRYGHHHGILANQAIISAAFSDSVLKQNSVSGLITLANGNIIVLRLKERKAARVAPLSQVKPIITKRLAQQVANKQARQLGEKLVAMIQSHHEITPLLARYHLHWRHHDFVSRYAKNSNPTLLRAVFLLPLPSQQQAAVTMIPLSAHQYAVVNLQAIRHAKKAITTSQQRHYQKQMALIRANIAYRLYRQYLFNHATIWYDDKMLKI